MVDDLQKALALAKEQRDAEVLLRTQAETARIAAEANAAQALLELAQARAAAAAAIANAAPLMAGATTAGNLTFALSPALVSTTLVLRNLLV
jgi:glucokinase